MPGRIRGWLASSCQAPFRSAGIRESMAAPDDAKGTGAAAMGALVCMGDEVHGHGCLLGGWGRAAWRGGWVIESAQEPVVVSGCSAADRRSLTHMDYVLHLKH